MSKKVSLVSLSSRVCYSKLAVTICIGGGWKGGGGGAVRARTPVDGRGQRPIEDFAVT